jgi:methyl-accepting chemotaxis protein
MGKIINSLQTKLIASFVLLILIIAGGTFFYTYGQTKKALLEITRKDLHQIIGIVSTQITPDEVQAISQLRPGEDETPTYLALKKKFQDMRALSENIANFYVIRVDGSQAMFLLDDVDPTDNPAKIGQIYQTPEAKIFSAVDGIQISDNVYTDEWGTYLSGYAPVKGADGKTAFLIGADMLATTVIERQNFIGNTIYLIMGIGILVTALMIGFFSLTIIRDINKLNHAAQKISMGETDVRVDVRRKDEIGELAESFERMVASLKIMMNVDESQD